MSYVHITNSNSGKPIMKYPVDECCSVGGIGRTAFYKAIGTGGHKTLILASLHRFIEGLPIDFTKTVESAISPTYS
jgi:hypothetical protein